MPCAHARADEKDEGVKTRASEATLEFTLSSTELRDLGQRFDILAEVGRGGMSIVYRARDREMGDIVALPLPLPRSRCLCRQSNLPSCAASAS